MPDHHLSEDEPLKSYPDDPNLSTMASDVPEWFQRMMQEHSANPLEYKFIWKGARVITWVASMAIFGIRRGGPFIPPDPHEKYPDVPNVNSMEELSELAHRLGWKNAHKIKEHNIDEMF
ncbi:MAG: hypothetical protein ACRCZF_09855 [Gemmataceae bacterium]